MVGASVLGASATANAAPAPSAAPSAVTGDRDHHGTWHDGWWAKGYWKQARSPGRHVGHWVPADWNCHDKR
ncbi:hypothetical protein ACIGFK_39830 [Streptomyces sp. NPDC085524]|uniref:hypothetical protein n=1 Tax=Streptomyces sp. NPDC085524 TaxID=3365728 RepID=UPI0037D9806D